MHNYYTVDEVVNHMLERANITNTVLIGRTNGNFTVFKIGSVTQKDEIKYVLDQENGQKPVDKIREDVLFDKVYFREENGHYISFRDGTDLLRLH